MHDRLRELATAKSFEVPYRRFDVHAIYADRSHLCLDAHAICFVFENGSDLVLRPFERFAEEGVCLSVEVTTSCAGGGLVLTLIAGNMVRMTPSNFEAHHPRPETSRPGRPRTRPQSTEQNHLSTSNLDWLARSLSRIPPHFRTIALNEDGTYDELDAPAICVDLFDEHYLALWNDVHQRRTGGVMAGTPVDRKGIRSGGLKLIPGAANVCYVGNCFAHSHRAERG